MRALRIALLFAPMFPASAFANGHGPVFGLATPTLGQGAWSLDVAAMGRFGGDNRALLRPMLAYGITEDLQFSLSVPMPLYARQGSTPPARMMAMMPATPDVEGLLGWRFARQGNAVGSRFESTAYLGFDYPTDGLRGGVATSPGFSAGAVTGYASRSVYLWAGALYRRYMSPIGPTVDHVGDTLFYSLVLGYRPPYFRKELPQPDWRVFVEAVGEHTFRNVRAGAELPDTGGERVFVGPTVLGLFGAWGISGGPLFPVYQGLNGTQPSEKVRLGIDFTYWF
jgi:hypothetical protein